ncbi:MAG TPA: hypothetical protein VFB96_02795 [Pirellulaceae bacterium]|nr:hypothetical protein [Pirellulaceae bacterium]
MPLAPILARGGGRFLEGLFNGDPVAWGILVLVLIFSAVGAIYKFRS